MQESVNKSLSPNSCPSTGNVHKSILLQRLEFEAKILPTDYKYYIVKKTIEEFKRYEDDDRLIKLIASNNLRPKNKAKRSVDKDIPMNIIELAKQYLSIKSVSDGDIETKINNGEERIKDVKDVKADLLCDIKDTKLTCDTKNKDAKAELLNIKIKIMHSFKTPTRFSPVFFIRSKM